MKPAGLTSPVWSRAEDAILRADYERLGPMPLLPRLPGRTRSAIVCHAQRMGLAHKRKWVAKDSQYLQFTWGHASMGEMRRRLGRTEGAIILQAKKLGLQQGVPRGYESLTSAWNRSGYAFATLRHILNEEGVKIYHTLSRRTRRDAAFRSYVSPDDVDAAIARWAAKETVEEAARRHGMSGDLLKKSLRAAGLEPPKRYRAHWRLPSAFFDTFIEERGLRARSRLIQRAAGKYDGLRSRRRKEAA